MDDGLSPSATAETEFDVEFDIEARGLDKTYGNGFRALHGVDLSIRRGEILALLGPNGAGKTTLISAICGLVRPTAGSVRVRGFDIAADYRRTRALIGLVPQELNTDTFETVWNTVSFSRGLFGLRPNPDYIEKILRELSLWDKAGEAMFSLSGGMKRRVMIAKALSHEPRILFLDEPTAGVDVELRQGMWRIVRRLNDSGVTIILTTHYIEEAEEMADRVAIIDGGKIVVVDEKDALMRRLGQRRLTVDLAQPLTAPPQALAALGIELATDGYSFSLVYEGGGDEVGAAVALRTLVQENIEFKDFYTEKSSLEEIFVDITKDRR